MTSPRRSMRVHLHRWETKTRRPTRIPTTELRASWHLRRVAVVSISAIPLLPASLGPMVLQETGRSLMAIPLRLRQMTILTMTRR